MIKHILVTVSAAVLITGCAGTSSTGSSSSSSAATPGSSTASAAKTDKLENIPLVWRPTTSTAKLGAVDLTGLADTKLQIDPVADTRSNPGFIGQNSEKQPPRKVTTPDSVSGFVTDHLKQLMSAAGINVVDSGGSTILKSEIQQFFVDETETYRGDVRLKVTLTNSAGKTLWTGVTSGTSTRFGRSYKADNYYETLSDSLIEATYNLLQNSGFRAALAGKSSG